MFHGYEECTNIYTEASEKIIVQTIINMLRYLDNEQVCPQFKTNPVVETYRLNITVDVYKLIVNALSYAQAVKL